MMKLTTAAFAMLAALSATGMARASDADDTQWIAKCMLDNKSEGASTEVVEKYCKCMNDEMGDSENRTVTEWEKTHKAERDACSAKAGWK